MSPWHRSRAVVSVGYKGTAWDTRGQEGSRGTWRFTPWFPGSRRQVVLGVDRLKSCATRRFRFSPLATPGSVGEPPAWLSPGWRDEQAAQSSKQRQKPRPRRARRSALTGAVDIPSAVNSRPITSRQTPISSAIYENVRPFLRI